MIFCKNIFIGYQKVTFFSFLKAQTFVSKQGKLYTPKKTNFSTSQQDKLRLPIGQTSTNKPPDRTNFQVEIVPD